MEAIKNNKGWKIKLMPGLICECKKYGRKTYIGKSWMGFKFHQVREDERYKKYLLKKRIGVL